MRKLIIVNLVFLVIVGVFSCDRNGNDSVLPGKDTEFFGSLRDRLFSGGYDERLLKAEEVMDSDYVLALAMLDSVNVSLLGSKGDKALYALLYTMALDKNHRNPTDDSLISTASNWFTKKSDRERAVISHYYQGRVRYHNANYPLALISFFTSKEMAESDSMYFWAGMSCRGIADIYNKTYNYAEQVTYAEKEYEYIKRSGKQPYLNYALLDLAWSYNNSTNDSAVGVLIEQMADSATKYKDGYLLYCAIELKAFEFLMQDRYDEALPLLTDICVSEYAEPIDSLYLSYALAHTGAMERAVQMLDVISYDPSHWKGTIRYDIHKRKGEYTKALQEMERLDLVKDSLLRKALGYNLTSSVVDNYTVTKKLAESELRSSRKSVWLVILGGVIVLGVICYVTARIVRKQKSELDRKMMLVEQLREMVSQADKDSSKSSELIKILMASRYELLREFSSIMQQSKDESMAQRRIAESVTVLIKELSQGGEKIKELEHQVDAVYDNLFSDFRRDLPDLKDADYRLYLFSILGFKSGSVSLFLNVDNVTSVYDRKRRLKDKIKELDEAKRTRYMRFLY